MLTNTCLVSSDTYTLRTNEAMSDLVVWKATPAVTTNLTVRVFSKLRHNSDFLNYLFISYDAK